MHAPFGFNPSSGRARRRTFIQFQYKDARAPIERRRWHMRDDHGVVCGIGEGAGGGREWEEPYTLVLLDQWPENSCRACRRLYK